MKIHQNLNNPFYDDDAYNMLIRFTGKDFPHLTPSRPFLERDSPTMVPTSGRPMDLMCGTLSVKAKRLSANGSASDAIESPPQEDQFNIKRLSDNGTNVSSQKKSHFSQANRLSASDARAIETPDAWETNGPDAWDVESVKVCCLIFNWNDLLQLK